MSASKLPPDFFSDPEAAFVIGESYGWKLTLTGTGFIIIDQAPWCEESSVCLHPAAILPVTAEMTRLAALALAGKTDSPDAAPRDSAVYLLESGRVALAQPAPWDPHRYRPGLPHARPETSVHFHPAEVAVVAELLVAAQRVIELRRTETK